MQKFTVWSSRGFGAAFIFFFMQVVSIYLIPILWQKKSAGCSCDSSGGYKFNSFSNSNFNFLIFLFNLLMEPFLDFFLLLNLCLSVIGHKTALEITRQLLLINIE